MATYTNQVNVRLADEDRRKLQERADAEGRKPADLARHLVRQGLDAREKAAQRV